MISIERVSSTSDRYPKLLREIYDPPPLLMARGCWPDWESRDWIGVVGARKVTSFGKKKAYEIGAALAGAGCGVVSGLAYGVDAEAHRGCLEAKGVTWGVLGSGLDHFYPARNKPLAEKMLERGGYLSEFPLDANPYKSHFIQRNRIISGLSKAVIIVEAAIHSGSLVTARYALEQGREVFVVEPPNKNVSYEGNWRLLDEGACAYESAEQVVEEIKHMGYKSPSPLVGEGWGEGTKVIHPPLNPLPSREGKSRLLHFLKSPASLDQLVHKTQKSPQHLLVELSELESQGLIKKTPGPLWQSL
ncbi:MAG: DNA-processing protein DprA [Deltaproteobacteria bacterium]|nr:DNA-processing protein DprA [Deltaproteobacteria bacterium]